MIFRSNRHIPLNESEQEGDRFFTQDGPGPVAACIEIDCLAATLEFSGYVARRKTYQQPCQQMQIRLTMALPRKVTIYTA
jgi:hypothetical protein